MSQIAGDLRYANAKLLPLEDAELKKLCPAAFAAAPRSDVSARYGFVSTIELIHAMRKAGFVPTQVNSYMRRATDAKGFTKHMIRFRPAGDMKKITVGDVAPQIVLINSHDRSSQFHLMGGLWRYVCENGLMVSDSAHVVPLVVRHTVNAVDGLLDATGKLIMAQKLVFDHVDTMKSTTLNDKQARLFAEQALALRPERAGVIDSQELLTVRRPEDEGMDLWRVFNRTQENLMRGGMHGVTANKRAIVTRGITSINADITLNQGLWHLAMEAISKAQTSAAKATKAVAKKAATAATAAATAAATETA